MHKENLAELITGLEYSTLGDCGGLENSTLGVVGFRSSRVGDHDLNAT